MKIPKKYLDKFDSLDNQMDYGDVTLILHKKHDKRRYEVGYLESFVDEPTDNRSTVKVGQERI